jgi:hypothetical protein
MSICKSKPVLMVGIALVALFLNACGRRDKSSETSTNENLSVRQTPGQAAIPAGDSESTLKDRVRSPVPPPQVQLDAPGPEAEQAAKLVREIVRLETDLMKTRKEIDAFRAQAASKPEARERIQRLQSVRAEKAAFVAAYPPLQAVQELAAHAQAAALERGEKLDLHAKHSEHGTEVADGADPAPIAGCEFCEQDRTGTGVDAKARETALREMAMSAFEAENQARQASLDIMRVEQEALATKEGQALQQREREALDAVEQVLRADPEVVHRLQAVEAGAQKQAELEGKVQKLKLDSGFQVQSDGSNPPERKPATDRSRPPEG